MAHLFSILLFFGLLVGLAALLEAIVRDNIGAIGAALRTGPAPRPTIRSKPARWNGSRAAA
jgi:hypothetical protein